ncbi:hypothetical protein D3C87_1500500 [compost metagenome]
MLAELVLDARHDIAGRGRGHDEGADAALAGGLVGHGHDDGHVGVLAAGDELLHAVEHVVVAIAPGGGAQRGGVRADVRLGQAERAQHLAARQRRQPLLLLRVVGEGHQHAAHRAVVHADDGGGAAVPGGNFLEDQRQRQVVEPRPAQLFRHGHAIAAQRGQFLVHGLRKGLVAVPLRRLRGDDVLRELPHGIADHFLFGSQQHGVRCPLSPSPYQGSGVPS